MKSKEELLKMKSKEAILKKIEKVDKKLLGRGWILSRENGINYVKFVVLTGNKRYPDVIINPIASDGIASDGIAYKFCDDMNKNESLWIPFADFKLFKKRWKLMNLLHHMDIKEQEENDGEQRTYCGI